MSHLPFANGEGISSTPSRIARWLCIGGIKEHFRFDTDPVSLWFKPSSRAVRGASRGGKGHRGYRYYLSRGERIVGCCDLLGGGEWPGWGKFKFETGSVLGGWWTKN